VQILPPLYQIPLWVMLPKESEVSNLLSVASPSASHVGMSTLRMEPQFMMIGHAAGTTAALALGKNVPVQRVDLARLNERLRAEGMILDLPPPKGRAGAGAAGADVGVAHHPTSQPTRANQIGLTVYRSQNMSWVDDLSNSDTADDAGQSCYIQSVAPESVYASPVLARYRIAATTVDSRASTNSTGYANCPDVHIGSVNRTCHDGNPLEIGGTACTYPGKDGLWFSMPAAGQCSRSGSLGVDCYWRVDSIDKVVAWACMRERGCHEGLSGCPTNALVAAFEECPDVM
jgi:hypothetical protein